MLKTCAYCGTIFETRYKGSCCSKPDCREKHKIYCQERERKRKRERYKVKNIETIYSKVCPVCGVRYETKMLNKIYCSEQCAKDGKKMIKANVVFPYETSCRKVIPPDHFNKRLEERVKEGWYNGLREKQFIKDHCIDLSQYSELLKKRQSQCIN